MNSELQLVKRLERFNIFTSSPKAGDDKRKECEEERGGGGKEWDLDGLVELVGEQHEPHQQRHHQEAVAQGRVGRGPPVVLARDSVTWEHYVTLILLEELVKTRRQELYIHQVPVAVSHHQKFKICHYPNLS